MEIISGKILLPSGLKYGPFKVRWNEGGIIVSVEIIEDDTNFPTNSILCAGFIDLQVNGINDVDVRNIEGKSDWSKFDELLLRQGTTSWCPTVVTSHMTEYAKIFESIEVGLREQDKNHQAAHSAILGLHLEGPYIGHCHGAHQPHYVVPIDLNWLENLPNHIAIMTLGPEQDRASEATQLLRSKGVCVSMGHTSATKEQMNACQRSGANMVTHLFNAMSGVHHRQEGVALVTLTDDSLYASIIVDLHHVSPDAVNLAFRSKGEKMILITDALAYQSRPLMDYYGPITVSEGAPRTPSGTLAGSMLTMNEAVRNCVLHCGVDPATALRAASSAPARVLGLQDRGEIREGLRADLVLLSEDYHVLETIASGKRFTPRPPPPLHPPAPTPSSSTA